MNYAQRWPEQDAIYEVLEAKLGKPGVDFEISLGLALSEAATNYRLEVQKQKDQAYSERNKCVVGLMLLAKQLGYTVGITEHPAEDTDWEDDWRTIAVIYLPQGQLTWHFHDSEKALLSGFPYIFNYKWDGHTTEEKYSRLLRYCDFKEHQPQAPSEQREGALSQKDAEQAAERAIAWLATEEGQKTMTAEINRINKYFDDLKKPPPSVWDVVRDLQAQIDELREKLKGLGGV